MRRASPAVVFSSLLAAMPAIAFAQPEYPDTIAGERAEAYFEAVLTGEREAIEAMLLEQVAAPLLEFMPVGEQADLSLDIRALIGALDSVVSPNPNLALVLADGPEGWYRFSVRVHHEEPHKIIGIGINPADPPEFRGLERRGSDGEMTAILDDYVIYLADVDRFSGAVLVARDGEVIFERAAGEASKRWGIENTPATRFSLGSANKLMTAMAIMQLRERGLLGLDDLVGDHLSDYPGEDVKTRVTIHHLLTHTGGTGDHFGPEYHEINRLNARYPSEIQSLFEGNGVAYEPDSELKYSNAGYYLLGMIVEAASGMNYYDYCREFITGPLGMADTDFFDADMPVPNVAEGYIPTDDYLRMLEDENEDPNAPFESGYRSNVFVRAIKGASVGGGYSSVRDLSTLADAWMNREVVGDESFELMTTHHMPWGGSGKMHYGYGVMAQSLPDGRECFGHGGDFPGVQTRFCVVPDLEGDGYYTIAVQTNYAQAAMPVYAMVQRLLPTR